MQEGCAAFTRKGFGTVKAVNIVWIGWLKSMGLK